jgi:hypothetical protein
MAATFRATASASAFFRAEIKEANGPRFSRFPLAFHIRSIRSETPARIAAYFSGTPAAMLSVMIFCRSVVNFDARPAMLLTEGTPRGGNPRPQWRHSLAA